LSFHRARSFAIAALVVALGSAAMGQSADIVRQQLAEVERQAEESKAAPTPPAK